jgi:hypothetical protein
MLKETAKTYGEVCGDDSLKFGDSGSNVEKLQARLKELGYYRGKVDGNYSGALFCSQECSNGITTSIPVASPIPRHSRFYMATRLLACAML